MRRAVSVYLTVCILAVAFAVIMGCGQSEQTGKAEPKQQQQYEEPEREEPGAEEPAQKVFVGSTKSDKFHRPDCEWAKRIKPANRIWFSSAADARAKGYKPCKVCKPTEKG